MLQSPAHASPPILSFSDTTVRHITPPQLDSAHLGAQILCHRPMRQGGPCMEVTHTPTHVIAHNYGHGGSGWTLAPGAAAHVITCLQEADPTLTQKTPITIIGAGVIGLFSAYVLIQRGFTNLTIVAEHYTDLASHHAGGLLAPVSLNADPYLNATLNHIGIEAYQFYKAIAQQRHPHFTTGAQILPCYFETRAGSGLESYVGTVMQPAKPVLVDFGNGTHHSMVVYDDGIFIDTIGMMQTLRAYLDAHAVRFVQKRITDFTDIPEKYIIHCSGMGARILNQDPAMVSVQGHLVLLKNQNPQDLQYMMLQYGASHTTRSGHSAQRAFYVFPKPNSADRTDIGVIGGTFIPRATHDTPNVEEFEALLEGARAFYGIAPRTITPTTGFLQRSRSLNSLSTASNFLQRSVSLTSLLTPRSSRR